MQRQAWVYVVILSLFWGTNLVASRFGIGEFDPFLFIFLRLSIAIGCFLPVLLIAQGKFPLGRELWWKSAVSGLLGVAIPIPMFILSLQYQSSGVASLYVTTVPVMTVVAAHYWLPDEKLTRYKIVGVLLALAGALFLAVRGESGLAGVEQASRLGFVLIMIGLISDVVNTMFVRLNMKDFDPMQVTFIRLLTALLVIAVVTLAVGDFSMAQVTRAGYFSLIYVAIIGALGGQFMAFYIQRRFGATSFSVTSFLVPVVATVFGIVLLGEIVTWAMGVGVLLIGAGLYLINRQNLELVV